MSPHVQVSGRYRLTKMGHSEAWHVFEEPGECWSLIQQAVAKQ